MKKLVLGLVSALAAFAVCFSAQAAGERGCWARVRFQKLNGNSKELQLSELALYNLNLGGERMNSPLTVVADGTAATDLAVGQASGYVEGGLSGGKKFSNSGEFLSKLFDNSTGTKMYVKANVTLEPATESTWMVITMRLAANAKPTAYNLATANDSVGSRSPTHWIVECSTNGVDWTVADTRAGVAWPTTTFTWWNGGVSYPLDFDWDAFRVSYAQSEVYYAASNTPKPVPTVVSVADPAVMLSEGTDYTVSYANWDQLGTATATVTGIGAYEGSENIFHYTVLPAFEGELSSAVVTNDLVHSYRPTVTVRNAATHATLVEDTDYRIEYIDPTGFDAAKVNVIGLGNYIGNELSLDFTIVPGLARIPAQYSIIADSLATPTVGVYRASTAIPHNGNYTDNLECYKCAALLDFGTIRHLEAIGVSPRVSFTARCQNFRIRGSNDLSSWTLLHTNVLALTEKKLNHFKLNAVENGADFRYIVLDNVENLNVGEIWGYSKAMMVEATADPNPFASSSVESADAAAGVLVNGKLTCSKDGPASVSVFVSGQDYGDDYAQWSANGRRFDIGELADGETFQTRLTGLSAGLWHWRIFATRGNSHAASQLLPSFTVGSEVILPKAYIKNTALKNFYDGNISNQPETGSDVWIVFDLEGFDFLRNDLAGWRIWPRSQFTGRVGEGICDYGYDPDEGSVDWGVTAWHTNGQKRVYGEVSGVPSNIVWENDRIDISKTTLEVAPSKFFVPYVKRGKTPRYIRFRGFTNANCAEIEFRTVPNYVAVTSGNATIVDLGDQFAVVFSNAQASATLTSLRDCYLMRSLVVGGGGGGGKTMGGGGGGGQVVERTGVVALSTNDEFTITVGAGGEWTSTPNYPAGAQGGTSTLVYPDGTTVNAYGGGGGGGFSEREPTASANGQIGSGGGNAYGRTTAPTKGTHYNYGNPGGLAQGGGGGAGTPGENAGLHVESVLYGDETAYRSQAGYGGEGVTNDISGVKEVYGSGGGGGGGQNYWSQFHAPGGTHAGAGATRTDKTGGGDGNNNALPADEGFGAGGGAGSFSQSGGSSTGGAASKGGCGTVILRFTKVDMSAFIFEIAPIAEEFYYTGSAIEPVPTVTHVKDGSTVDPANYDVAYADNVNPGTATITVSGKGAYADLYAECSFTILNLIRDEYAAYDDFSVRRTNVNDRIVYVFTNTTDVFTFRALVNLTLVDALVVGGGGSGGHTIGGGGGGGAVVTSTVQRAMFAGREFSLRVGAGGLHATATSGYPSGVQGETSVLTFPDLVSIVAYGGGGGGGYQKGPTSSATGEIASGGGSDNSSAGNDGVNYSSAFGHIGGTGTNDYGGGGGGAGTAGQKGSGKGGDGGEGVVSSITGIAEVYGSGGGGGARNNGAPGAGGTNAGSGTNGVQTGFAPFIQSGRHGFGGGGGGGGYKSGGCYYGGDGGCGTIVLSFVTGAHAGQPTIASKSISFPGGITQPKVSVTLGNSRPEYAFVATVSIVLLDGDGNELGTKTFSGVTAGEPVEWLVPLCVEPNSTVTAQIMVASDGADAVFGTETDTATGEVSPYYGHGGGAGVIHVRPGATGRGDGSDWFNAYTDFRAAIVLLDAERPELWFAGSETEASVKATISPTVAAVIRGGFAGTEDSVSERVEGAMSICDAVNVGYCFNFNNSQPVTLDGFWLKRGEGHNLVKSGTGDITVTNCVSSDASDITSGHGGYLVGGSATVARFANVRFSNLIGGGQTGGNKGTALYLETFSRVFVDDCTFATNGCSFSYGFNNNMYDQDGAALFAKNAPITVRGTRFLCNRSQVLNTSGERGGVVRVTGACGATAFTNCLFVGNEVVHAYSNTNDYKSNAGGMLAANPSSGTVDIVNCTFAMGLAALTCGPAAVAARAGTVNVVNCIFYGNTNCAWNTAGSDIYVAAGATANVSYCLFEDDSAGRIVCAEGSTANLETSTFVYGNPLFVTDTAPSSFLKTVSSNMGPTILLDQNKIGELMAFNAHVRGGRGYFDEKTGVLVVDFKSMKAISPAQDTGNPAAIFYADEPDCRHGWHGRRGNLGYYGNTPWATMTAFPGGVFTLR